MEEPRPGQAAQHDFLDNLFDAVLLVGKRCGFMLIQHLLNDAVHAVSSPLPLI